MITLKKGVRRDSLFLFQKNITKLLEYITKNSYICCVIILKHAIMKNGREIRIEIEKLERISKDYKKMASSQNSQKDKDSFWRSAFKCQDKIQALKWVLGEK